MVGRQALSHVPRAAPVGRPRDRLEVSPRPAALGIQPLPHVDTDRHFAAHNFDMVGFVKELVDEVAWPDITSSGFRPAIWFIK